MPPPRVHEGWHQIEGRNKSDKLNRKSSITDKKKFHNVQALKIKQSRYQKDTLIRLFLGPRSADSAFISRITVISCRFIRKVKMWYCACANKCF